MLEDTNSLDGAQVVSRLSYFTFRVSILKTPFVQSIMFNCIELKIPVSNKTSNHFVKKENMNTVQMQNKDTCQQYSTIIPTFFLELLHD